MFTKCSYGDLGAKFECEGVPTIEPLFSTRTHMSAWLSKSQGFSHRLRGSSTQEGQLKKQT